MTGTPTLQNDELYQAAKKLIYLPLARKIYLKEVTPDEILTSEQFMEIVSGMGKSDIDAFEVYVSSIEEQFATIDQCLRAGSPQSAAVLLFTLIEGEVNTVVRMLLRIRGMNHKQITEAIQGTNLFVKMRVLLPLLNADPADRFVQIVRECQKIRNEIVHFKASPDMWHDKGGSKGGYDVIKERAQDFFNRTSIEDLMSEIEDFNPVCMGACVFLQQAVRLVERFSG